MNKLVALFTALFFPAMITHAQIQTDSDGHVLIARWKAYQKFVDADKPKDQLAVLEEIKEEALSRKLAWDYYDACRTFSQVRSSINWKDRQDARSTFAKEIDEHGDPVARFYMQMGVNPSAAEGIADTYRTELSASRNTQFWKHDGRILNYICDLLTNDYEYTQWSLFFNGYDPSRLKEMYGDSYPQAALVDYHLAERKPDGTEEMRRIAAGYKDKAVGFLAAARVLDAEFIKLGREGAGETEYQKLLAACQAHEKGRKALTGLEAKIAAFGSVQGIIDALTARQIEFFVKNGDLSVSLRNLPSVKVELIKGKEIVWTKTLENKARRFYIKDTLNCALPLVDDGEYQIQCSNGSTKVSSQYEKYSIATSYRNDSRNMAVFAADRISGEPLRKFTFVVLDNSGKELGRRDVTAQPDGFTPLPSELEKLFENRMARSLRVAADRGGLKILSRDFSAFKNGSESVAEEDNPQNCQLLTDRSAFNPGETVNYKVVLYTGRYSFAANPAGEAIMAVLKDPAGKELCKENLTTGEFGSAAGSFLLPSAQKGGIYRIEIFKNSNKIASSYIRVDEFVLPTFELIWEKEDDKIFFKGDTLHFGGSLKAYSGHSLGAASISYELSQGYGMQPMSGVVMPDADGSFAIDVPAAYQGPYNLKVKVTDATGETLEFNDSREVREDITARLTLADAASGSFQLEDEKLVCAGAVLSDTARFNVCIGWNYPSAYSRTSISYRLVKDGRLLQDGSLTESVGFDLDLSGLPSGLYMVEAEVHATCQNGEVRTSATSRSCFVKLSSSDTVLPEGIRSLYLDCDDNAVMVGISEGPVWIVEEMFGNGTALLAHRIIKLDGDRTIRRMSMTPDKNWPDYLSLRLLYFKNGKAYSHGRVVRNRSSFAKLPLSFTRFTDTTAPGGRCSLAIGTQPGVECALAVFDKSSEVIMPNQWYTFEPQQVYYGTMYYRNDTGSNDCWGDHPVMYKTATADGARLRTMSKAVYMDADVQTNEVIVEEEAIPFQLADPALLFAREVAIRSDFASTIAWAPFLRSDKDGRIEYSFTAADKLSTFVVQIFAHDRQMHNAVLRQEMLVTLPVKVAVVQPQFLIAGDRYGAGVTLSNSLGAAVGGTISCRFIDGADYKTGRVISEVSKPISVPAGGTVSADFVCQAPADVSTLGMLVTFRADNSDHGSDAVFVTIPIHPDVQTITEAHSAVLRAGEDRDALISKLRSQFVNVSGADAALTEVDILQMLRDAIPAEVEPRADDALSLVNAIYSNVMAERLGARSIGDEAIAKLVGKIMACHNSDGGFGWMEGMSSSPVITAVLMERLTRAVSFGWDEPEELEDALRDAAAYLDDARFGSGSGRPAWCGGISLEQYLYVRALYAWVPFSPSSASARELKEFRKAVREYLVPAHKRGLNGQILPKLRRILTLQALGASDQGLALSKAWGVRLASARRMARSLDADVQSELQYLVPHWSGGCYYPNAVMPFRGLLESELYAHVMLCHMLDANGRRDEADGIRLWIMMQKETQHWESDPAYVEAIGCVMEGSDALKATKVLALKATAALPLADVKASGNDMSVERRWFVMRNGEPVALADGQLLHVGDELRAEYRIWNRENRSFVLLTAPRPAMLRPADQLSAPYGWWLRPLYVPGWVSFSPQGYRSVFADRTEYRFDSYPEENTTVTERFFVTQQGIFHTPAVTIESLYAPHYRANDAGSAPMMVEP